jgi:hypothetical protein
MYWFDNYITLPFIYSQHLKRITYIKRSLGVSRRFLEKGITKLRRSSILFHLVEHIVWTSSKLIGSKTRWSGIHRKLSLRSSKKKWNRIWDWLSYLKTLRGFWISEGSEREKISLSYKEQFHMTRDLKRTIIFLKCSQNHSKSIHYITSLL